MHTCTENAKTVKAKLWTVFFVEPTQEVSWTQWETAREERTLKGGEKKIVTITVKSEEHGTVRDLWDKFHEQLSKYSQHAYNITNQYKHYKSLRKYEAN